MSESTMRLGADRLINTVASAGYWQEWGHKEPDRAKSLLNMDNAVNHWKNAAYGMAEESAKHQSKLASALAKIAELKTLAYELEGVIVDIEQGDGFDSVCLQSIKRVRDALYAIRNQQPASEVKGD